VEHSSDLTQKLNPRIRERLKSLVVDSVTAAESKRVYGRAIDRFLDWFESQTPPTLFNKAAVQVYRTKLINMKLSPSTVSLQLTAIRRLAAEAADNGFIASELAGGIARVKGVKRHGLKLGTWLTVAQANDLMNTPDISTLKGKRDRAILDILISCGLRRDELARLLVGHIQQRAGRWIIVDLIGKGGRVRSVPMSGVSKAALDLWAQAAGIKTGRIFRPVNKGGKLSGDSMTGQAVFETVKQYTGRIGLTGITPHHLRRTFARLSFAGKASLEQIQLSLGHFQKITTEQYVGIQQDLNDAPCDHLGLTGFRPPQS
jgi:site-specific recombinase XerD